MRLRKVLTGRIVVALVAVVVLAAGGVFAWSRTTAAGVRYRTAPVTLGTVTQTVDLAGNLTPVSESDLTFGSAGRVDAVDVQVGQQVTAGQPLASLDPSSLQASLQTAQANLAAAQAKLSQDEDPVTSTSLATAEGQVNSAEVAVQNAQTAYDDTVAANQQMVSQAQQQESSDCGANPSSTQCSQDQQTVAADRTKAQQSNDQAAAQLATARVDLSNAQASLYALEHSATSSQVGIDEASVNSDEVAVSQAQQSLDDATLASPLNGVVAAVNIAVGQDVSGGGATGSATAGTGGGASAAGAGASTASGSASTSTGSSSSAIVVIAPGVFDVTGSVSDAEVSEIVPGQSAEVVPAGAQEAVTGKVSQVAEEATISSGVATFPVAVTLDGNNPSLRAGMSATVSVIVNQVVQVMTVPTSAVHTTASGSTVEVLVAGTPQTVSVQVGASDATRTQILSGLTLGEQVVIATISSSVPTSGSGSGSGSGGLFGGGRFGGGGGFTGGGARGG